MTKSARAFLGFAKYAALVGVVCFGIWGCSRPAPATAQDRARSLENRCVQLEQDYRTVAQARDRARKDLSEAQEQLVTQKDLLDRIADLEGKLRSSVGEGDKVRKQLAQRTQERDDLRQQMSMRMAERAALMGRCDKLRKGLQSLLTDDEPATGIE
jgi:septal ring factor EnvC (AmiA/AmiB activator)